MIRRFNIWKDCNEIDALCETQIKLCTKKNKKLIILNKTSQDKKCIGSKIIESSSFCQGN